MSTCCNFTSAIQASNAADPLVQSWQARAVANGGTPSVATSICLNTFCVGIRAQTYFGKLKSVNFLAPDDFRCAMTPLIVHAQDQGLWLAQTGAFPSGGSAFVSAINAELGANGFRCDDCINPNVAGNNYTPAAIFTARDNWGVTVYQTTNDGLHGPQGMEFGVVDAGGNAQQGSANAGGSAVLYADDLGTGFSVAFSFYGYYSFNVSDATTRRVFAANSTHPHGLFMSSGAVFAGNLCTLAFPWAGTNQNNVHTPASGNWRSFIAAHDTLTTSESLDFYTRIQALRVCLGTGFV